MRSSSTYQLLSDLVSIPSAFPNERKVSSYIEKYLTNLGFAVSTVKSGADRNNLIATLGSTGTYVAFYGHMDTVQADKRYTRDPFTIRQEGSRVQGLGVADMKGGIVAILKVAEYARRHQLPVKLVFGVDEENISVGAHDLVDSGMLKDIDFLVSAESGQVENEAQPFSICYGRRGRVAINVVVTGKKKHAAESSHAINAIEQAALFINKLSMLHFPTHPNFGKTTIVVHDIEASTDGFSVPDECTLQLSALTTPPIKHEDVLEKLRKLAQSYHIEASISPLARKTPYAESYEVDESNRFLQTVEAKLFSKGHPLFAASVADENIFANRLGIPVISLGPIGGNDHTADEWVDLSSIDNVSSCYAEILKLHQSLIDVI